MNVVTVSPKCLQDYSEKLIQQAIEDGFKPTILIGIPRAGLLIAEHAHNIIPNAAVYHLGQGRPTTNLKKKTKLGFLQYVPLIFCDALRIIEHKLIAKPQNQPSKPLQPDATDQAWLDSITKDDKILILDDAIDSGATMAGVVMLLEEHCPMLPDSAIKTGAITVTTKNPLVIPDYVILKQQLCRFPWSYDYR